MPVNRKVEYRLYLTPRQELAMQRMFEVHRNFYNNARQQRIDTYKIEKRSVSFAEQCRDTTQLRHSDIDLANCNAQSLQVTLKRIDLAFQHFFRRCKEAKPGEKPGFPRYKTKQLFKGWGYKTHGDGWKFDVTGKRKALLRLSGIGTIRTRGKPRTPGIPTIMEIVKRNDKWYAYITLVCEPKRKCGTKTKIFDWGLKTYLTVMDRDGTITKVENPRTMRESIKDIKTKQNQLKRKATGSKREAKLKKEIANIYEKGCNRRKDFLHKTSAWLVSQSNVIITEGLNVKSMVTDHSKQYSRGLHRSIMDAAPAMFNSMVSTKAQEAACNFHELETKVIKPSQRCAQCWDVEPKTLDIRTHSCTKCGFTCDRDVNAVMVMIKAFDSKGLAMREVSGQPDARKRETPPIVAYSAI